MAELPLSLFSPTQATAETVYDILSPTAPPSRALPDRKYARKLRRSHQPADLREGVAKAYDTVREVMLLGVGRRDLAPFWAIGGLTSSFHSPPPCIQLCLIFGDPLDKSLLVLEQGFSETVCHCLRGSEWAKVTRASRVPVSSWMPYTNNI